MAKKERAPGEVFSLRVVSEKNRVRPKGSPRVVLDLAFRVAFLFRGDFMLKGKRFHFEGQTNHGGAVFSECMEEKASGDDGVVVRVERARPGEPVPYGQQICHVLPVDERHVEIEEIEASSCQGHGPAMVTSDRYRQGRERVFGANGVN